MKKMTGPIDVQLACDDTWVPELEEIRTWSGRALRAAGNDCHRGVSIRIVEAADIQALNRDFRHLDEPTNVLAFATGEIPGLPAHASSPLGDVIVCAAVINAEAESQGKTSADHWAHIIVHGTLHLLGYNHEMDDEATAMEALEKRILGTHGVSDPYGESSPET
jgi:probable rRNA maturation factor